MSEEPTRDDMLAVCTFARRFNDPDLVAGEWISSAQREDGVLQIGYWLPSEDVARWQTALYEHHIVLPFDWAESRWMRQMRRYSEDPGQLKRARLQTIRKVLTTLVRAERFCEGSLARTFQQGVPQAATRRLAALSAEDQTD